MANELNDEQHYVLDPMNDFFGNFGKSFFNSVSSNQMKTDIIDNKNDYQIKAELPGFKKNDIHISYADNTLKIHAVHDINKENKDEQGNIVRQERSSSNISRQFYLPNVDLKKIEANYDGGMLMLDLPKMAMEKQSHEINIK